jgi:hypothetical protein
MTYLTDETQRRAAIDYTRQQLGSGNSLAKFLLEGFDFKAGTVVVLSAVPLSTIQITEFNWGHVPPAEESAQHITIERQPLLAYPKANSYALLTEVTYSSLQDPQRICILENMLASPGDPWLKRAKSRVATHGTEVYHIVTATERLREKIEDAVREAASLPVFVGAIGWQPPDPILGDPADAAISTGQLRTFAKTADCIFVGAHDGEGYVVWHSGRR